MPINRRDVVIGAAVVACLNAKGAYGKSDPKLNRKADLLEYFKQLPNWDSFAPSLPDGNVRIDSQNPTPPTIQNGLSCTQTEYSLSKNSDKLVIFEPDRQTLWPGALIQGKGYRDGLGSIKELPIKKRAALALGVSFLSNKNNAVVLNPTATTVNSAIAALIDAAIEQKTDFGSSVYYSSKTAYSAEQALLSLGISAKYAGASVAATHQTSQNVEESSVATYFVQNMFTIFVENTSTPADLFTEQLTVDDLKEQEALGRIGTGNIPVFISSISFGRILYATITAKAAAEEIKTAMAASFNAANAGGNTSFSDQHESLLRSAQISVTAIGGPQASAQALIKSGKTADFFNEVATTQSVRPISFTFTNLSDLSIAAIRDATTYKITECSAAQPTHELRLRADAIDLNRAESMRFFNGANGNWADPESRAYYMRLAGSSQGSVVTGLRSLERATLPSNDKAWLKTYWIPRFLAQIEEDISKCGNGIRANSSDPGTAHVWQVALAGITSQRVVANSLMTSL